ncbi:MAG: hypothetical protein AAFP22_04915, partial [Planctomycetota bacterium]
MRVPLPATCAVPLAALLAVALPACSDGSGTDSTAPGASAGFEVVSVSVSDGDVVPLNRSIDLVFSADVDARSVSATTVQVVDGQGWPVLGAFSLPAPRRVRFEPACPSGAEPALGGLDPGADYTLRVPSTADGNLALLDASGRALAAGAEIGFRTPDSLDPAVLFDDATDGPPALRVAGAGDEAPASYVEFTGLDANGDGAPDRSILTFDPSIGAAVIDREVPLNLYSVPEERFAFVLRFDQPVDGRTENLARVRLEHRDPATSIEWHPLPATRTLESNCGSSGAQVRITPLGVVPGGHELRVALGAGFSDLVGQALPGALDAVARVRIADSMPDGLTDAVFESFDGTERLDPNGPRLYGSAEWTGTGSLDAAFGFAGKGGPGGDFDWVVPAGAYTILNTDADTVMGGPGGVPATSQPVVGGVVQVRNFTVQPGAILRVVGSAPLTILATGEVRISGWVQVDGRDRFSVALIDTTNQPEVGAAGAAGGGAGGTGSPRSAASSERGGAGEGAFGVSGGGGQGGESGYAPAGTCASENRRGAGGGGGRFGDDVVYPWFGELVRSQTLVGMDAERGIVGSLDGTGAVSQFGPAQGGARGPQPFADLDDRNDFFGALRRPDGSTVRGELPGVWAGSGGGGGGDASTTAAWPLTPFHPAADEKGAGGGGGGGSVQILSLGDIVLEPQGSITADGGHGGGGESTIFFDRVGGGSGGGSGGHIVLASATRVVLAAEADTDATGAFYHDALNTLDHEKRPLRALGGQGGAGREGRCGAGNDGDEGWSRDSIPIENFGGDGSIPPQDPFNPNGILNWARLCTLQNHAGCAAEGTPGETFGAGGDGGPGIVQIHVQDPSTQLVLGARGGATGAYGAGGDPTYASVPPPLGWTGPSDPISAPLPLFGARSEAVTRWIPLGLARNDGADAVELLFGGTDPATGLVLRDGDAAAQLEPLVGPTPLDAGSSAPSLDVATASFTFPGVSSFDPTGIYRRNPALTRGFAVRIDSIGTAARSDEFIVQSGVYDEARDALVLTVDPRGAGLESAANDFAAPSVTLVPYFVRLVSDGELDAYPAGSEVRVLFDAARAEAKTDGSVEAIDVFSGGDPA